MRIYAQETSYGFKYLGMEDGLSFRDVTGIVQDKNGMIWVGTRNGLNKYDGYTFEHFNDFGADKNSILTHSRVNSLAMDTSGFIWVGTNVGIDVLNPNDLSIVNYAYQKVFKSATVQIKKVEHLEFLQNGRKFIQSYSTRCPDLFYTTVEFYNGVFIPVKVTDSELNISYEYIKEIFQDKIGNTWVRPPNSSFIYQIDQQYNVLEKVDLKVVFDNPNLDRFSETTREDFLEKKFSCNVAKTQSVESCIVNDSTFVSVAYKHNTSSTSYLEFYEFHLESKTLLRKMKEVGGTKIPLYRFYDHSGNTYFSNGAGLSVLKKGEVEPINFLPKEGRVNRIKTKLQSSDNTVWIGSSFGLFCLKEMEVPFRQMLTKTPDKRGIGNRTRAIHKSNDKLYVSVVGKGIVELDLTTNEERVLINYIEDFGKVFTMNAYGLYAEDSTLWLSIRHLQGIFKYRFADEQLSYIEIPNDSGGFGTCLYKDSQNRLWQGTTKGINLINQSNESNETIEPFQPKNDVNLRQYSINAFYELSPDTFLVATEYSGVFYINSKGEFLTWVNKEMGLSTNTTLSIQETEEFVWVGTSSGLNRVHKKTHHVKVFTSNDGLANNNVYNIVKVDSQLWCSTDFGLSKLNEANFSFENFLEENGVTHHEFNAFSSYQANDSIAYLGGQNGLLEIKNHEQKEIQASTSILLTEFTKYNSNIGKTEKALDLKDKALEIYPDHLYFTLSFSTTNYFESDKIRYFYQIKGLDQEWIPLGRSNKLRINRMSAGNYTFQVKAMLANGKWVEQTLAIPIKIHQVFYKTSWFILLCIIGFLLILYFIYQLRVKQIQKVERLRLKIASDLHDDVSTQLTQISLKSELMKQNMYNEEEQQQELTKMSLRSRELVGKMSDIIWSIDSRKDKMEDLIDRMRDHLSELGEGSGIYFELKDGTVNTAKKLSADMKRDLYLIFKEAINNTIKHSNATRAYVNLSEEGKLFRMEIKDNGKAQMSEKSNGQGLENMKMRVNKMKGELSIWSDDGFKILVQLPL